MNEINQTPQNKARIDKLFAGEQPYTPEELAGKTYRIKVQVEDVGWVEVETTTEFVVNGMLNQISAKLAAGIYFPCEEPQPGEKVVILKSETHNSN